MMNQRKSIEQASYFSRHKKKPSLDGKIESNMKKTQNLIKKIR